MGFSLQCVTIVTVNYKIWCSVFTAAPPKLIFSYMYKCKINIILSCFCSLEREDSCWTETGEGSGPTEAELVLKGTVRPDWICIRVVSLESPLKGHQPL